MNFYYVSGTEMKVNLDSYITNISTSCVLCVCCRDMSSGNQLVLDIDTSGCQGQDNEVNFLEHVQVIIDMDYSKRGDLAIHIISPNGT